MYRSTRIARHRDTEDAYSTVLAVAFSIMGIAPFSFMLLADLDAYLVDSLRPVQARTFIIGRGP